jgi:hypothetical protein
MLKKGYYTHYSFWTEVSFNFNSLCTCWFKLSSRAMCSKFVNYHEQLIDPIHHLHKNAMRRKYTSVWGSSMATCPIKKHGHNNYIINCFRYNMNISNPIVSFDLTCTYVVGCDKEHCCDHWILQSTHST